MSYQTEVLETIKDKYNIEDLKEDSFLFTSGLIDSFGIIDLISELESKYDISLGEEDLTKENLETVGAIAKLIEDKKK